MGKTAVFVLATLQQLEAVDGQVSVLVMCHTRELAFQISKEYERFSKYMSGVKVSPSFLLVLNSWNLKSYVLLKLSLLNIRNLLILINHTCINDDSKQVLKLRTRHPFLI